MATIVDVSPARASTDITIDPLTQSVSGKALCIAMSANGRRLYLGGHSGVWRSRDSGRRWEHPERPTPPPRASDVPGALYPPSVYDLLISPTDEDVVLAATGGDSRRPATNGIYRSTDAANSWELVHRFTNAFGEITGVGCLTVASDDPDLMFAAGGLSLARSEDAGITWTDVFPQSTPGQRVWYVVCGPSADGGRRMYAVGSRVWVSLDGGLTWAQDPVALSVGPPSDTLGPCARSVGLDVTDPTTVYLARRPSGQPSELWRGKFPTTGTGPATWTQLSAPPFGAGTTASGTDYVVTHRDPSGQRYLIYSDRRTVHLALAGDPTDAADWIRLDGSPLHVDPHGIALTPDFGWQGAGPGSGRIAMVNDGGAAVSGDGADHWDFGTGLTTLGLVNTAVLPRQGKAPGIVIQCGDNSGFSSRDGGSSWRTQDYVGGDNDCSFADPVQPNRLIVFAPRDAPRKLYLYRAKSPSQIPDASVGTPDRVKIPGPPPAADPGNPEAAPNTMWNCTSAPYNAGNRPVLLTLDGEAPRPEGDFIAIWFSELGAGGQPVVAKLLRTTAMSGISDPDDWVTTASSEADGALVFQQGPDLPDPSITVAQASGGHEQPTFYVGNQESGGVRRLWKWRDGLATWQQVIPGTGAGTPTEARRFFVDPYRPDIVYVLGTTHVHVSRNGGQSWGIDTDLEAGLTQDGAFPPGISGEQGNATALLRDMVFHPTSATWRVAIGPAGVFQTRNARTWDHLLHSAATATRPNNAVLDRVTSPGTHHLYVSTSNRGVLRIDAPGPRVRTTLSVRGLAQDCLGVNPPISVRDDVLGGQPAGISLFDRLLTIRDNC